MAKLETIYKNEIKVKCWRGQVVMRVNLPNRGYVYVHLDPTTAMELSNKILDKAREAILKEIKQQ